MAPANTNTTNDNATNVADTTQLPEESNDAIIAEERLAVNTYSKTDTMSWDDLALAKNEAVNALLAQQMLLRELILQADSIINSDPELKEMITGLAKAYDDVTNDIRRTMDKHYDGVVLSRTGPVTDDDYLEYLQIAGEYITYSETIATLSGTGYLDIFTRIKSYVITDGSLDDSIAELTSTMTDGTKAVSDLQKD